MIVKKIFKIHFDLLQQNESLTQHVQFEINKIWNEIDEKDQMIDNVIIFLNNKTCFELSLLGINDRTTMI
jgi:hypothetical protein